MKTAAIAASRLMAIVACACAVVGVALFAPTSAWAIDIWSAPYEGVRMLHRRGDEVDVRVLLVDLSNPAVSLVATRPADRMITVSEFARRYEADIAINANFFDNGSCGLMVGEFEVMENAYEDRCTASIAFGLQNEAAVFDSTNTPRGPLPAGWMSNVLSGKPFLMRDGVPLSHWTRPQHLYRPNPRSVLGLTADRHTLVMILADGRRRGVPGLTAFQLVALLREFAVRDAVNLDGGGSTELVMGGEIVNRPSDGRERIVLSHLGIRIRPGVRWDDAALEAFGSDASVRSDEIATLWLEVRNLGRRTWRRGEDSPVLSFDDGTVGYVATVEADTPPGMVGRFVVHWLARGEGERHLHAELRTATRDPLDVGPLDWSIRVDPPRARFAPARDDASAVAALTALEFPAGLGAVSIQAASCSARPERTPSPGVRWAVFALLALVIRRRQS